MDESYYIPALIAGLLSSTYSLSILIYFIKNPNIKNSLENSFYFIVIQSIDLLVCIASLMNPLNTRGNFCQFQGYLQQFLSFDLLMWDLVISLSLFYDFIIKNGEKVFPKKSSLVITTTISALISLVPFFYESYGSDVPFCSIIGTKSPFIIFGVFYIPFIIVCIINGFCLIYIEKFVRNRCCEETCKTYINILRAFPLSLLVCYTPLCITRIMQALNQPKFEAFYSFSLALSLSHGMLNGIIVTYAIRKHKRTYRTLVDNFSENKQMLNPNIILNKSSQYSL